MPKIKLMNINGAIFIGDHVRKQGQVYLSKPRIISVAPQKDNSIAISIMAIIGSPEEMAINKDYVIWDFVITDKELLAEYTKVTTGLIIPFAVPRRMP